MNAIRRFILTPDTELAKILLRCNSDPEHFAKLEFEAQQELKFYCKEIVKYGGTTHAMAGGRIFTDNTLLQPAKRLLKSLRRKKEE